MATGPRIPLKLTEFVDSGIRTYRVFERRLWVPMQFEQQDGQRFSEDCLLDTGAPLCVIAHEIHHGENLRWDCLTDPDPQLTPYAFGSVPADIGRVQVWLQLPNGLPRGPFTLHAKFPRGPVTGFQSVLLGLNFFAEYKGEGFFQYGTKPADGYADFA